ncbi:MAG TPA: hypothetical protein VNK03_03310 [Gammaproteobacteria bacterium]|nr:hypothetical protein [Gammaproteobacteria bacterium]
MKVFQYLKALDPDQKRVVYAYLCALAIGSLASILSFGFGATLALFLSPVIKVHFARLNTADVIETHDGKILTINDYAGYFKLSNILTPCLIFALFVLIAVFLDYDFFGVLAFLLILSYYAVLSAYMIQHKLPLLSAKRGARSSDFQIAPLKSKLWEQDDWNRNILNNPAHSHINNPAYSHIPGNIFHRS